MKPHARAVAVLALGLGGIAAARFGGWAVVSVESMPDYLVAGQPATITFAVRQHGDELLRDIRPSVVLTQGRRDVTVKALPAREGRFNAHVTAPAAGEWRVTIESGFGRSKGYLLPLPAIAPGAAAPVAPTDAERGRMLFAARGCVTCHVHRDVDLRGELSDFGPDLTTRRFAPQYLAQFLADPLIKPPSEGKTMPKPHLGRADIPLLVAFINADRKTAAK